MLSDQQVKKFKERLDETRQGLEDRISGTGNLDLRRSHFHDATGDLSSYDNHPGDEGTELFEREKDLALYEHYHANLDEVNHALAAIEAGEYGRCEVCSREIPLERLEVLPTTTFCIDHTPSVNTSHMRPAEEDVIGPPFGRFDEDDQEDVAFDAEDSWQDVAQYGTSETPSDFNNPPADYSDMYIEAEENVGYVENYENFVGVDLYGRDITVYPSAQYEELKDQLIADDMQTPFGDLPRNEHDPYVEEENE